MYELKLAPAASLHPPSPTYVHLELRGRVAGRVVVATAASVLATGVSEPIGDGVVTGAGEVVGGTVGVDVLVSGQTKSAK
jgi:hypothetical protein